MSGCATELAKDIPFGRHGLPAPDEKVTGRFVIQLRIGAGPSCCLGSFLESLDIPDAFLDG